MLLAVLPLVAGSLAAAPAAPAQQYDPALFSALRWRLIGPFRGGRTVGAAGVHGAPDLLYLGVNNGGAWKSADYGRTWTPIFDAQPTGSIGAIAVAPSNPDILYVGSGESDMRSDIAQGDGMFKSEDGGRTWRHIGLADFKVDDVAALRFQCLCARQHVIRAFGHQVGDTVCKGHDCSPDCDEAS